MLRHSLLVLCSAFCLSCNDTNRIANLEKKNQELQVRLSEVETKSKSFDFQERCSRQAREDFKLAGWEKQPLAGYTNHYNSTFNKCFILITSIYTVQDGVLESRTLSDVNEGKVFGRYVRKVQKGKKNGEVKPFMCSVDFSGEQHYCDSSDGFDNMVKPYMEE